MDGLNLNFLGCEKAARTRSAKCQTNVKIVETDQIPMAIGLRYLTRLLDLENQLPNSSTNAGGVKGPEIRALFKKMESNCRKGM